MKSGLAEPRLACFALTLAQDGRSPHKTGAAGAARSRRGSPFSRISVSGRSKASRAASPRTSTAALFPCFFLVFSFVVFCFSCFVFFPCFLFCLSWGCEGTGTGHLKLAAWPPGLQASCIGKQRCKEPTQPASQVESLCSWGAPPDLRHCNPLSCARCVRPKPNPKVSDPATARVWDMPGRTSESKGRIDPSRRQGLRSLLDSTLNWMKTRKPRETHRMGLLNR